MPTNYLAGHILFSEKVQPCWLLKKATAKVKTSPTQVQAVKVLKDKTKALISSKDCNYGQTIKKKTS